MDITEVQVKLIGKGDERLKASCTLVVDGEFVIRDVKVIEGTSGLFVAMPSRKLTDHCPRCSSKNHLRALYCNHCGSKLAEDRWTQRGNAQQMHVEIAHPINSDCRHRLHERVISAYEEALENRRNEVVENDADDRDDAAQGESHPRVSSERDRDAVGASRSDSRSDDFGSGLL